MTLDHIVPRSRGGNTVPENLCAACLSCNQRKGDRTPEEKGWHLRVRAYVPRGPAWVLRGADIRDPAWEVYLGGAPRMIDVA